MKTYSKSLTLFSLLFLLFACGGGGSLERDSDTDTGSGDSGDSSDPTYTVSLTLVNQNSDTDRNLATDNPLTINASVIDDEGAPVADTLITFSLSNADLASFSNDTGTARTDDSGSASIGLVVGAAAGDGQITATLPDGTTGTTTFTSAGSDEEEDAEYTVTFSVVNAAGDEDKNLASDNPLTVNLLVVDQNDNPLTDALVTFSLSNDDLAVFSNDTGTARTDSDGRASIVLTPGTVAGDGQITVTLPDDTTASTTFSSTGTTVINDVPADLELYANSLTLASSGSDEVELIALVKNSRSILMEGVEVTFSAPVDAGLEIQQVDEVTGENGIATAIVTSQNDASFRTVQVTATAGEQVQTVDILIVGTEVTINGAKSMTVNDSTELTIRVQDSDGTNLTNQEVLVTTTLGELRNTDEGTAGTSITTNTGTEGQGTIRFVGTASGLATISAEALNVTSELFEITVQQDDFGFSSVPDDDIEVAPDNNYEASDYAVIEVTWNKDGAPFAGGEVTFSASRGDIRPGDEVGTTGTDGKVSFSIASTNAGLAAITATGVDNDGQEVSASIEVEFVATNSNTILVDASPDQIGPDGQTSTITAIVRDPAGNLVKDEVVNFTVNDTSTGSISPSQATTDSNGIASTVFTSGGVTSEDAVLITATVQDKPSVTGDVTLTVGNRAFDVSIGTGNEISKPDSTTYLKEFAVFVTDAVGQPVEGVALTASSTPVKYSQGGQYFKGGWIFVEPTWTVGYVMEIDGEDEQIFEYTAVCANEDINANGILEIDSEDTNDDGFLTPGIIGSVTFKDGVNETDANGQATLELRYPREYAAFYEAEITVFAQSTGSEASASMKYLYGIAAEDASNENIRPPSSPFGTGFTCTNTN